MIYSSPILAHRPESLLPGWPSTASSSQRKYIARSSSLRDMPANCRREQPVRVTSEDSQHCRGRFWGPYTSSVRFLSRPNVGAAVLIWEAPSTPSPGASQNVFTGCFSARIGPGVVDVLMLDRVFTQRGRSPIAGALFFPPSIHRLISHYKLIRSSTQEVIIARKVVEIAARNRLSFPRNWCKHSTIEPGFSEFQVQPTNKVAKKIGRAKHRFDSRSFP